MLYLLNSLARLCHTDECTSICSRERVASIGQMSTSHTTVQVHDPTILILPSCKSWYQAPYAPSAAIRALQGLNPFFMKCHWTDTMPWSRVAPRDWKSEGLMSVEIKCQYRHKDQLPGDYDNVPMSPGPQPGQESRTSANAVFPFLVFLISIN